MKQSLSRAKYTVLQGTNLYVRNHIIASDFSIDIIKSSLKTFLNNLPNFRFVLPFSMSLNRKRNAGDSVFVGLLLKDVLLYNSQFTHYKNTFGK